MKPKNVELGFSEWFARFIRETGSGKRLLPSGKKIRKSTLIQYKFVYQLVREFEEKTGRVLRITLLSRGSVRLLNQEKRYWTNFYNDSVIFYMLKSSIWIIIVPVFLK